MDPAQALSDLTEISAQIESAILVDAQGAVVASTLGDPARAEAMARAARELLAAAGRAGEDGKELAQLEVSTTEGSVFIVRDEENTIAAVTTPEPTVGLVFYDLKTCLRHVAGEELAPKPKARAGSKKAASENGQA